MEFPVAPAQALSCEHLAEGGGQAPPVDHLPTPENPVLTLSLAKVVE